MSRGTKDLVTHVQTQRIQARNASVVTGGDPRRPYAEMYEPSPPSASLAVASGKFTGGGGKQPPNGRILSESDEDESSSSSGAFRLSAAQPVAIGGGSVGNADALMHDLKTKVERQKLELDSRTDNVNAIQRNFQRLSEMYSADREKLVAAEQEAALLREELNALRAEKKFASAVRAEFAALKAEHDALRASSDKAAEEHKQLLTAAKLKITTLEKDVATLRKAVDETTNTLLAMRDSEQRIVHCVSDLETRANAMLLAVLDAQKSVLVGPMTGMVGTGVGFVAPPPPPVAAEGAGGAAAHRAASVQHPIRIEAVAHALQVCSDKGVPVLIAAHRSAADAAALATRQRAEAEAQLAALAEALDAEKQLSGKLQRDAVANAKSYEQERQRLQSELAALSGQLSTGKTAESETIAKTTAALLASEAIVRELTQRLADATQQSDTLRVALAQLQVDTAAAARLAAEEAAQLRAAHEALGQESLKKDKTVNEQAQRLHAAATRLAALQDELNHARDAAKALQSAASSQVSQVHTDLAAATRALGELQQMVARQELALAELKQLKLDHEALLKSRALANASVTALTLQLEASEKQRARLAKELEEKSKGAQSSLVELQQALAQREVDNNLLREQLAVQEGLLGSLKAQVLGAATRERQAVDALAALQAERDRLLAEAQVAQANSADKEELVKQLNRARTDSKQLDAKIQTLLAELSAAAALSRDLAEARLALQKMQGELAQAIEAGDNARSLQQLTLSRLDTAEQDRRACEAKMRELQATTDVILATQSAFEKTRRELEDHAGRAAARARHLRTLQEETCKTVKKLLTAEKSCESGYSCQQCLALLKDPIVCAPCGHVYCRKCFEGANKGKKVPTSGGVASSSPASLLTCVECDMTNVSAVVNAHSLDLLSGKFQYRCQVLSDLSSLLDKELASAPL